MKLSEKQQEFTKCIGKLIAYAYTHGYALTLGDAYRDARVHGEFGVKQSYAAKNSVHKIRLAIDLNLFVDDQYVSDSNHPVWFELSKYWEGLHKSARSGLRFKDANHFSFTHWGVK